MKKIKQLTGKIVIILSMIPLAFGLVTGCGATTTEVVEEKYIPVEVEVVSKKTLVNTAVLSGKVSSDTEISVLPEIAGKVESVSVKVGDYVNKGAVLFTFEATDMRTSYQLADASYQKTKESLDAARATLARTQAIADEKIADARKTLANTQALYEAGAASKNQLDQAELGVKELEKSYADAIAELTTQVSDTSLRVADVQLTQAREALAKVTVTAPIDGVVSQVNVIVGNMASPSQVAVSMTNTNNLYSEISVAENLVNRISKDQEVKVTVPAVSAEAFTGYIEHVSPSANPVTNLYTLKIMVTNPEGLIKPGMFAKIELATDEKPDVMAVKSEAVILKNDKNIVYIVEEDRAVAKEVVTGLDAGVEMEIIQGINVNDQVITKGQTIVTEGSKVKIIGGEAS